MQKFDLRQYQRKAILDLRQLIAQGSRRLLLVAPTGSGKTVIAAQIVQNAYERGKNVLFLAHRRELVNQCAGKLEAFGVDHGVIMAGEFTQMAYEVQVASVDTLRARAINNDRMPLPRADLIFIDECHRALAPTYWKIANELYPQAVLVGLTATPIRGDGKGLGHLFDGLARCPSVQQLTDLGHLVPARSFVPTIPDLTGVKVVRGDYDQKQLEAALDKRELVGDIVTEWLKLGQGRSTVVFASGVRHSMHLAEEFKRYTTRVAHLDGETPLTTRQQIIKDLKSGALQVVCNFGVMTEGFDEPRLSCCVLARATKLLGLYLQMAGRTLRPFEEGFFKKRDSIIIDHSGNVYEHGYVADDHDWVLDEGKALTEDNKERQRKFDEKKSICCTNCSRMYEGTLVCPHCGNVPVKKGKWVSTRHGELVELRAGKRRSAKKRVYTAEEKELWYRMLLGYAIEKKKNPGSAYHRYKEKFGVEPWNGISKEPMSPNNEVRAYVRYTNIKYAKGKALVDKAPINNVETDNQRTGTG